MCKLGGVTHLAIFGLPPIRVLDLNVKRVQLLWFTGLAFLTALMHNASLEAKNDMKGIKLGQAAKSLIMPIILS